MRNYFYYIIMVSLLILSSCRTPMDNFDGTVNGFAEIDSLLEIKDFFAAREQYERYGANLTKEEKLISEIFLYNAFNKPGTSREQIEYLNHNHLYPQLTDSLRLRIKSVALDNSIKLYDYNSAKVLTEEIIENFPHILSPEKLKNYQNTLIIWTVLKDQPRQEVFIKKKTEIEIIKDKAGLSTLKVHKDNIEEQFVFDTGANFSTITESTAAIFGLTILEGKFEVNSITGTKIDSRIAIAPQLFLGAIEISNAVFLVFPDEALGFTQIDYQINGIIGFPVIEALKEIQITRDDKFIVPLTPSISPGHNLAIDLLTPLVLIKDSSGNGTFTFDTGAGHTMLYNTYFERYLSPSRDTLGSVDYSFGGAGGNITKKGIYIPFNAEIGGAMVVLDSVIVLKEELNPDNKYLGNIGQDIIGKFDKMTINFDQMFIRFD